MRTSNSISPGERRLAILVVVLTTVAVATAYVIVTRESDGEARRFESEARARALIPREPLRVGIGGDVEAVESQPSPSFATRTPATLRVVWDGPLDWIDDLAILDAAAMTPEEDYRTLLEVPGDQLSRRDKEIGESAFAFDFEGEVGVFAVFNSPRYHTHFTRVRLVRGETTKLILKPAKRPVVRGLVVDHQGEPVKGARVRAWSRCKRLQPSDIHAGSVGYAIAASKSLDDGIHLRSFMTELTDADGRFSGTIGTTEEIAIEVDAGVRGAHTETYEMRDRFADLVDLRFVLAPPLTNDRRPRVVGKDGREFANEWFALEIADLSIAESGGRTNCEVDEFGMLAFERLEVGKRYSLFPRFVEGYATTAFTFEYGMTVMVSKVDP